MNRKAKRTYQKLWDVWCNYQASQRARKIEKINYLQCEVFAGNKQ